MLLLLAKVPVAIIVDSCDGCDVFVTDLPAYAWIQSDIDPLRENAPFVIVKLSDNEGGG